SVADLNILAHRIAELALTPGVVAQDGFLTTHLIESVRVPERELIAEFLGRPDDLIDTPTPAQRILYGPRRRRIPELWDVDNATMTGVVQNQDAYMQSVAAQRPYFFDHIRELTDNAFADFYGLTGRRYERVLGYRVEDAEYLLIGQGSVIATAEAVADYLRETRGLRVGVLNLVMWRPFPGDLISRLLKGKRAATVLERLDQPLAIELPLIREIRACVSRCFENGANPDELPFPDLATYRSVADAPSLHSASFGMGSRDLQPEGLIGAIENMLPKGARKKFFYLSIDFVRETALGPKDQLRQDAIRDAYPGIAELAVHGSENPDLMPPGCITVRFHSVGGWGAITTGKNLAMTLYELLGYHIKANPKYGSEKKGQPTTYFLAAAPEPIRVNCEYIHVDVVLSPDPNVFRHTNALAGLKPGGCFIIQSDLPTPEAVWASIPSPFRKILVEKKIELFYLDGFGIAREEASDPDLRLRMQGIAFQGAFFAATPVARNAGLSEDKLLAAIHDQLHHKFGAKGARIVEENLRVVKRGHDEVKPVPHGPIEDAAISTTTVRPSAGPPLPVMLRRTPVGESAISDPHRFWEQTASFYARGMGSDNLTDPFIGLSVMPAATAVFRDMTSIRFAYPRWIAENCTACGNCYTACPDTAIPGLVNEIGQVFDAVVERMKKAGKPVKHLPKAVRQLEPKFRQLLVEADERDNVRALLDEAILATSRQTDLPEADRRDLAAEFAGFTETLGEFSFALSRPFFTNPEAAEPGGGGLLSITVNPETCKGCMQCVEVCNDDALRPEPQTVDAITKLRREWDFWLDLPNTPRKYIRIDDLEEAVGALHTLLLDKNNYQAMTGGDGACLGCGEKTVVHLFTATVEALMRPRIERHVAHLDDLITRLQQHVRLALVHEIDVGDTAAILEALDDSDAPDVTLAHLAENLERRTGGEPIDRQWLRRVTDRIAKLKRLRWQYVQGQTGRGRARLGFLNSTGCSSVWGSTFPYNPYPFPWANHLFQDSASLAMGVFEGHMAKMADGFKTIRLAEIELSGEREVEAAAKDMTYFDWEDFTDEEWELCPPVVAVGGDGAMYDIGFQNLSRALMSGKPIKVLVLDTQVYSNTGGQACTAGFTSQISDMAPYGKTHPGKTEIRKEMGLIGMAHRTAYVMQSTIAHPNHMIEGFIHGLKSRRPALFNLYTSCQPEHGIGDDRSTQQARLVVEGRGYPLFRYDPAGGPRWDETIDLEGNPAIDQDWPTYDLKYLDGGRERTMTLPMTFADFAVTEIRFRKHFRVAPPETWNDNLVPLHEFLEWEPQDREGKFPYIWSIDRQQVLSRLLVAEPMVLACEERRDFWKLLRGLARTDVRTTPRDEVEAEVRQEVTRRIAQGLYRWVAELGGDIGGEEPVDLAAPTASGNAAATADAPAGPGTTPKVATGDAGLAPWIDSDRCTACDECIKINPNIFAYNANKKAIIKNPRGGPYRDLVKAAERCTAQIIHPGLPLDRAEKDLDRWIERGKKRN
ncbi:MAG: pyruvate ferredoxin oxidoreductase, partial [Planctomycetaceae bacterium]